MSIIGLGYEAQVGKDTIANYLVNHYQFQKISFADRLRSAVGIKFGLSEEEMLDPKLKDTPHPYWDKVLNIYNVLVLCECCGFKSTHIVPLHRINSLSSCPECTAVTFLQTTREPVTRRLLLKLGGTEAGREVYGLDLWILTAFHSISHSPESSWVIPDVRFPNEAQSIIDAGGKLFLIKRSIPTQVLSNTPHASEVAMVSFNQWTDTIDNNGTFSQLYAQVEEKILGRKSHE